MMPFVEELLARSNNQRIVRAPESMAETRARSYALDSGLAKILGVIMAMLVLITSLGIVGLASFSVRRRTKQIGTRRALGAKKRHILRYFLVENFVITTLGVLLGAVMTVGFNVWLVQALNFPKIDWLYVPIGMIALWLIGKFSSRGQAPAALPTGGEWALNKQPDGHRYPWPEDAWARNTAGTTLVSVSNSA